MKKCTVCKVIKDNDFTRHNGNICDTCRNQLNFEQRVVAKIHFVKKTGGKCQKCGYCNNLSALDFHHLEERTLARGKSLSNYKNKFVEEEIDKCILLCKNCHAEEHNPRMKILDENDIYFGVIRERECFNCGNKTTGNIYCCHKCSREYERKVKRPTKEELESLIAKNSWTALGKKFNVSDNAVRKWAKSYGLIS